MNALTVARTTLATALTDVDGPTVYPHVPELLEPPCLVIQPAPNYVTPGDTFDTTEHLVSLELFAVTDLRSNLQATEDLDELLTFVLARIPDGYWLETIAQPGPIHTADWIAHALTLTLTTRTHL